MKPELVIIADDLTGAMDTGILFSSRSKRVVVISHRHIHRLYANLKKVKAEILSIHTNSRSLPGDEAAQCIASVVSRLKGNRATYIYKKVDSCLRGNIGEETEAVMEQMGYETSFIAPAFPEMGRTTLNDIHYVHNQPVTDCGFAKDPVNPVRTSCVSSVAAEQCNWKVGHINLETLESDEGSLKKEIQRLRNSGARHLVFDAALRSHLDKIVHLANNYGHGKILLAGSAGLAGSLVNHFPENLHQFIDSQSEREKKQIVTANYLMVIGTTSAVAKNQITSLRRFHQYKLIRISSELLINPDRQDHLVKLADSIQKTLEKTDLIIRVDDSDADLFKELKNKQLITKAGNSDQKGEKIIAGLGFVTGAVLRQKRPAGLYLSGGDTAHAVMEAIGAWGILLKKQISPGMVCGIALGGIHEKLPVVTKAGAFGDSDSLLLLHNYWLKSRKEPIL